MLDKTCPGFNEVCKTWSVEKSAIEDKRFEEQFLKDKRLLYNLLIDIFYLFVFLKGQA